ncbi:MAG: methyltransferase family protein [Synechococcaceae cyanobacterium]
MPTPPPESGLGGPLPRLLAHWGFSRAGWGDNRRGEWWLAAQLTLIAAVLLLPALPAPATLGLAWPLTLRLAGGLLLLLGLLEALRAVLRLGASLTPLPEPMPGSPLVRQGVYAHCRHPLYRAVLVCALGMALLRGSLLHLGLLLALAGVLGGKARREERSLVREHPDYAAYRADTVAILPALPWLDWRA